VKLSLTEHNRWPIAITVALLAQVAFGVWMVRTANGDPHFAVLPDYYARGVAWDSTMAQAQRDKALGWRAAMTMTRTSGRRAALTVDLRDAQGAPVRADSITIFATAIAHSMVIDTVRVGSLQPLASGTIEQAPSGLWELSLRAHRGDAVFTATQRLDLP
jgi:nitrogen fixation protein FixH